MDGHIASLFPGTTAVKEEVAFVSSVYVPSLAGWRVTLTIRSINESRRVLFLVAGEQKRQIVGKVLGTEVPTKDLPATMVQPRDGTLRWMIDADAASDISSAPLANAAR